MALQWRGMWKQWHPYQGQEKEKEENKLIQIKSETINKHSLGDVQILACLVSNNWDMEVAWSSAAKSAT
jgi:hypothetical protein